MDIIEIAFGVILKGLGIAVLAVLMVLFFILTIAVMFWAGAWAIHFATTWNWPNVEGVLTP